MISPHYDNSLILRPTRHSECPREGVHWFGGSHPPRTVYKAGQAFALTAAIRMPEFHDAPDVRAKMAFILPTSTTNRRYVTPNYEVNTGKYEDREVMIRNARPFRNNCTLKTTGFILCDHVSVVCWPSPISELWLKFSQVKDFRNKEEVDGIYHKEIED